MSCDIPDVNNGLEFDPETETYRATFDSSTTDPSIAVVYALADVCDTEPTNLVPLSDVIETRALNQLCNGYSGDTDITVVFVYHDHRVRVKSYGLVEVWPDTEE